MGRVRINKSDKKILLDRDIELLKFIFEQFVITRKQISIWLSVYYNIHHPVHLKKPG
jgi:hypothetical protein